ncbi:RNI-like protein [Punctularia strigosozonata HHB-11173 SS5]|uniref:RNI-like protein n=1 Tax=Punctularia strigosozonata (strain HHB-11173) TaxID=741275 RepID=UPI0004418040|nr:RNI-like protein [Punctularia strigosozonata HHB-11173 SS5]EIN13545.1 RNI-like protein [Punctularia strigosozonata HHB-11173 SS5]
MARLPTKRRRTDRAGNTLVIGAPNEDDLPSARTTSTITSTAYSTRSVQPSHVPALTTLCARAFIHSLKLLTNGGNWESQKQWLEHLPDHIVPRLFAMMRAEVPDALTSPFMTTYLLRGPSITLTSELLHVKKATVEAVGRVGAELTDLEITGQASIPESTWVQLFKKLPSLKKLNLRGCTKVDANVVATISRSCRLLTSVNLNQTSATPASIAALVLACRDIEVLKLAGIQPNWTDAAFARFLSAVNETEGFELVKLRNLKLRQLGLGDASLHPLLKMVPNLNRLDLSFTGIRHLPKVDPDFSIPPLEKLSLTSTMVFTDDVLTAMEHLPRLKTLNLGALGASQGRASLSNSSALTMTPAMLRELTSILAERCPDLEVVSLVGNTKLGMGSRDPAVRDFIAQVGRRCKTLNMAAIPGLRSGDLAGLLSEGEGPPRIETLNLSNTSVDDEAAQYISCCESLQTLEVAGTKFTPAGLFPIIDACEKLQTLDLTSCRGIKTVDRRRFFEVWESEWRNR